MLFDHPSLHVHHMTCQFDTSEMCNFLFIKTSYFFLEKERLLFLDLSKYFRTVE